MLYFLTKNTTLLRNILLMAVKSTGKLRDVFVMALYLCPIFNRNLLYQTLEGTHEILCSLKNISNVLDSGTQHCTGPLSYLPKGRVSYWYCWSLTSVQHHIDHVALGHASLAWFQIFEELFSLFPSAFSMCKLSTA